MAEPRRQQVTTEAPLGAQKAACNAIIDRVGQCFVGKRGVVKKLLAGSLSGGHVLFEDYPGLGKTLLVKAFSKVIGADHKRVQFTPDILPSDILGTKVWDHSTKTFRLTKGPVFTNVLLADEINRSPPKTQSALLESMEERQVTIDGETLPLPSPFFVLATQNPIEQEGTYPLPEAQMDRFILRLSTGYPDTLQHEGEILARRVFWKKDDPTEDLQPVLTLAQFRGLMKSVETDVFIHEEVIFYIARLVRGIREHPMVEVGPSPRGSLALLKVSRAISLMAGRDFVVPDDVKMFASDALSHRTILKVEHVLEGATPERVVQEVVENTTPPSRYRVDE
ncbi:MAG: MoxR family ATPase [Euryarchaeota archaeon]|nr:MoxR family ATPase [Euryarchaeota archaeon]